MTRQFAIKTHSIMENTSVNIRKCSQVVSCCSPWSCAFNWNEFLIREMRLNLLIKQFVCWRWLLWRKSLGFIFHFPYFINSKTFNEQRIFQLPKAIEILEQEEFDNSRPTVVYLHGFEETMKVESIRVIAEAYLKRGDHSESRGKFTELIED